MNAQGDSKETESPPQAEPQAEVAVDPAALVARLQEELAAEKNKYLYLYAEFDNFKKRTLRERSDLVRFGHEGLARELLSVKDNFERGLASASNLESLTEGLRMVAEDMKRTLERFGITEVKTIGEIFDPTLHEAMGQAPGAAGVVVQEFAKGYTLHNRLLRPAKVVVGSGQTQT